jgi:hypothetical protein
MGYVQDGDFFRGTFKDPKSGAMRHDSVVTKSRQDYLVLNVLPGCVPIWAFTSTDGQSTVVPTEGGLGQEPLTHNYLPPAGILEGYSVPVAETLRREESGRLVSQFP